MAAFARDVSSIEEFDSLDVEKVLQQGTFDETPILSWYLTISTVFVSKWPPERSQARELFYFMFVFVIILNVHTHEMFPAFVGKLPWSYIRYSSTTYTKIQNKKWWRWWVWFTSAFCIFLKEMFLDVFDRCCSATNTADTLDHPSQSSFSSLFFILSSLLRCASQMILHFYFNFRCYRLKCQNEEQTVIPWMSHLLWVETVRWIR